MSETLNKLSQDVNAAVNEAMSGVQDYVSITLQKEYYKCGYECFNRNKGEIPRCIERCSLPVQRASAILDSELKKFQDRLTRSMLVCRDRIESTGGFVESDDGKIREMETCMQVAVREQMKSLPQLADHIKTQITNSSQLNLPPEFRR